MTDFRRLLETLARGGVRFILVGGAAATAHGSARLTADLDVVYARDVENVRRLVASLAPFEPYLRGAPPGLPFRWAEETLLAGVNFTLTTSLGPIDLLGEITGGGRYEDLLQGSVLLSVFGFECRCLSLEQLIRVKRAAGRPRDLETVAELEAIREERGKADRG